MICSNDPKIGFIEINNSIQFSKIYIEKHMIELQFIWYLFRLDGMFGKLFNGSRLFPLKEKS